MSCRNPGIPVPSPTKGEAGISPSPLTGEGWGECEGLPHFRHIILSERSKPPANLSHAIFFGEA